MPERRAAASWRASLQVLATPRLRRAERAYFFALTGEWALTVALSVIAYQDGGAAGVGLVGVARMAPSAIATPLMTSALDRFRRERALAAVILLRAAATGVGAGLLATEGPRPVVYVAFVLATIAFTVFRPTHSALLPLLCSTTTELTCANVVRGFVESAATLAGPALAGALLATSGPPATFAAAAGLSVLSAVDLLRIDYEPPTGIGSAPTAGAVSRLVDGLRTVVAHPDLRWIFGLGLVQTAVRGALNVFVVVLALELLDLGESGVASLSAAIGVGGLVGAVGVSLLGGSRHLGTWLAASTLAWGLPITVMGAAPEVLVTVLALAVVGGANTVIDVPLFTLPVRLVDNDQLTRVFGLFESVVAIGVALGSVLAPLAIGALGAERAMIVAGLVPATVAFVAWRPLRALDHRLGVRDTEIAVLRSTALLQLLPVPSIEYLARDARRRTLDDGAVACRQGDEGESFFVIAEGTAEVTCDQQPIDRLGPGDAFGEVSLLEGCPRTATVTATGDLVVLEVSRPAFLDAVVGHRPTRGVAGSVVSANLARVRPDTDPPA